MIEFRNLFKQWHNSQHTIAVTLNGPVSAQSFISDCKSLISRIKERPENEAVLTCLNSYNFAVGFFSLIHENKKICLPPGIGPGSISELSKNRLIISDFHKNSLHPGHLASPENTELHELPNCQISLFTSGSTGERKEVRKTLNHFLEEIAVLSTTWPTRKAGELTVSTVSHQHIYGLLFKVLWPMLTGSAFYSADCLHESDLKTAFKKYPDSRLISCPAHLDAMLNYTSTEFLVNHRIFSSGAPLSPVTSAAIKELTGQSPFEVFGSTETGGIAWRQQTESALWAPLENVKVKTDENNTLFIHSPFCEEQNSWYKTADKAEISESGHFQHLGRCDRIVKVSGKRLSLTEMENKLLNTGYLSECRIITLREKSRSGRESCAALCKLNDKGVEQLTSQGRREFAVRLKEGLKKYYDPVLIPRFWRYVDSFPVNSQGKVPSDLLKLFFAGYDEKEKRFPELKGLNRIPDGWELNFTVPENCTFFDGHFEDVPILPGVGQLFWVQYYSEALSGKGTVRGINRLKFHQVILPGNSCKLTLSFSEKAVNFNFAVHGEMCSSGNLAYE